MNRRKDEHLLARINVYDYSGSDDDTANIQENNIEVNSLQVDDNNRMFEAITTRRTNRFRFEDRNIPDILLADFIILSISIHSIKSNKTPRRFNMVAYCR